MPSVAVTHCLLLPSKVNMPHHWGIDSMAVVCHMAYIQPSPPLRLCPSGSGTV